MNVTSLTETSEVYIISLISISGMNEKRYQFIHWITLNLMDDRRSMCSLCTNMTIIIYNEIGFKALAFHTD